MIQGQYAAYFVDELLRLLSDRPGWPSTLLKQSTIGLMEELGLAGAQVANGILTQGSFSELAQLARSQVLVDHGLGALRTRGPLLGQIASRAEEFVPSSYKAKAWLSALPALKADYCQNWRDVLSGPDYSDLQAPHFSTATRPAESASFIAAHLLYLGFSAPYLSRWFNYRAKHDPSSYTLERLFHDLENQIASGYGPVQVLVTLTRQPPEDVRSTQGWLDVPQARQWLSHHNVSGPRTLHGAILYESNQWDIDGALINVAKAVHRLTQRTVLKTGKLPAFHRAAWIAGVNTARHLPDVSQLGKVLTPGYELSDPQVAAPTSDDRLEVAVELLLSSLSESGPSIVGTLWAAVEALLAAPGDPDRMQAALRAADIALVALVRSSIQISLGTLFARCPQEPLAQRLDGLEFDERLVEFERALRANEHEILTHRSTRLALDHTRRLLDADYLKSQRTILLQTFRGLYRQRNLVLHGGITDAPLLEGIIRSATPLVTAVVNRYARARQSRDIDPHVFAFEMYMRVEAYIDNPRSIVSTVW